MSGYRGAWARLREDRRAMAGLGLLAAELLLVLLLTPLLGLEPNVTDRAAGFWAAPSGAHWLGTDEVGRDVLARLICGGRVSLLVGFASAALSLLIGVPLGLLAGYRRGKWEFWIMRCADVFQSFPSIVLILCLVTLVGPSVVNIILVIGLMGWVSIARLVYGNTLSMREKEYIEAARAMGMKNSKIIFSEILPNAIAPVWVSIAFRVSSGILTESSLSFLGLGVQTPQASWGNIIFAAQNLLVLTARPWVWIPPGICIILVVIGFNFIGEGVRDALDPKMK